MRKLVLPAILFASFNATAAEVFQFKGMKLGDSQETIKTHTNFNCANDTRLSLIQTTCYRSSSGGSKITFGGAQLESIYPLVKLLDGKVGYFLAEFSSGSYQQLGDALVEKYGKPTKTTKAKVQTKAGVDYENEIMTWEAPDSTMTLEKFGSTTERSSFTLASKEFITKAISLKKEEAKLNAADL